MQLWESKLECTPPETPLAACRVRLDEPELSAVPDRVPKARSPEPSGAAPA